MCSVAVAFRRLKFSYFFRKVEFKSYITSCSHQSTIVLLHSFEDTAGECHYRSREDSPSSKSMIAHAVQLVVLMRTKSNSTIERKGPRVSPYNTALFTVKLPLSCCSTSTLHLIGWETLRTSLTNFGLISYL